MDKLEIIAYSLVGLILFSYIFIPKLRYRVRWRDIFRSWHNPRFQLFLYVNNQYQRVLDGKQAYYRFVEEIRKIYNKDNFTKSKSEFDNNVARNNLTILSEMLDDEPFIRKYFCRPPFTYDNFTAMMVEWDTKPQEPEPEPEFEPQMSQTPTNPIKGDIPQNGFSKLITKLEITSEINSCISSILKTINTGDEYAALIIAIKKYPHIQYSTLKEVYECINSSFNPGIKKGYNALSSQISRFENHACSEETEDRICELIEEFSKKLNEIQ